MTNETTLAPGMAMAPGHFQHRIHLRQLKLLVAIADEGSLARAAAALHVTQPAATKTLRQLEEIIGADLAERGPGGSALTPLGEVLCHRARAILTEIREAEEELGLWQAGGTGQVNVGAMPVSTPALIPKTLLLLAQVAPRVTVRVFEGSSNSLLKRLADGELDLVVGRFWSGEDPLVITEELYASAFRLHIRTGHPLGRQKTVSLKEASSYKWIMPPPGAHIRAALEDMFRASALPVPDHPVETTSFQVMRHMLLSSDMVAPLPVESFHEDVQAGLMTYVSLDLPLWLPVISIVRHSKRAPSPATITVMQQLHAAARQMSVYQAGPGT